MGSHERNKIMKAYEQVFQGDVWLMRLPDNTKVSYKEELSANMNKLILQEGEMTGHHHFVDVLDRQAYSPTKETINDDENVRVFDIFKDPKLKEKFGNPIKEATAKLYKDVGLVQKLVTDRVLLRADLVVGLLKVENGPMNLYHQEHGYIGLAPGKYIVGRQIESVANEERLVAD